MRKKINWTYTCREKSGPFKINSLTRNLDTDSHDFSLIDAWKNIYT
ncbi:hypothetical protein predicted by Glimmer/Critica [Acetobacter ghanensis]|uniref:Uncharacterized protein n=1 Tax=Acetobacter ghanensis TaxID=431306 RepID=A0A0U5BGK7_9PROT|nr:hypothetical protein predicted by Glimmer/Critica [Acetobacter ghanensis]